MTPVGGAEKCVPQLATVPTTLNCLTPSLLQPFTLPAQPLQLDRSVVSSLREICDEAGLWLGYGFHFHSPKGVPLPFPWALPSTGPPVDRAYLHRECPGCPWSGGVPASSESHSCLLPLSLWVKPGVRWSPGSASVPEGFAWLSEGFAWLSAGCF